ncbi:MAG TPA: FecR domain-containing protein [Polyangiales bacterium]|nr:FecR domain-containing protein [Polyangiales bacterium]
MTVEPRDLAAHLVPEITEGRLARQWASLEAKLPRPQAGPGWRSASLAVAALGFAAWLWWMPIDRPESGAVVESSDTPVGVQLRDGSSVELAAQTRLRVLRDQPTAVEVELADGRASFDVTHVDERSFTVRASTVAVHVIGTKFEVLRVARPEGTEVQVSVERGIVEVERTDRGDQRRLTVGERWSVWIPAEPAAEEADSANDDEDSEEDDRIFGARPSLRAAHRRKARSHASHRPARASVERSSSKGVDHADRAPVEEEPAEDKAEAVQDLFARANVARRAGMMSEAARVYADVIARFPNDDSRAAIAAFELGRIRMDALGDPRGAVQALNQALRVRSAASREDALARLAICYNALHDNQACRKARQRYLTEYPAGVHASALAALCGGESAEP